MKKLLLWAALVLLLAHPACSQTLRRLKVYQKDMPVETVFMPSDGTISHSRLDLDGRRQDDYVTLRVTAEDGLRQYLISQLDSLVLPSGRRVVFHGVTVSQPAMAPNAPTTVSFPAPNPKKTSFRGNFPGSQGADNVTFYWTENDRIRLDVGEVSRAQVKGDRTSADFVFDGADLDRDRYTVFYPDKRVTIPSVQTQTGADNTEHIGVSGDCGVAKATRQDDGSYSFTLEHQVAYLCFLPRIDYLPSVRVTKVVATCSGNIAGTFQLADNGQLVNGENTSKTIALNLNQEPQSERDFIIGHTTEGNQAQCASYMVIAPQDGNCSLTLTYHLTDTLSRMATTYVQTITNFRPLANTIYPVTCHVPENLFRSIDLGFEHVWANVNVDSNLPNEAGSFYTREYAQSALTDTWQLPAEADIAELLDRCTWEWGTYNGTEGWFVTGTNNGNDDILPPRIFLPLNGYKEDGVARQADTGYYWLAADETDPAGQAKVLTVGRAARQQAVMDATLSMNARPVRDISREFLIPQSGTQTVDLRTHGPGYTIKVYDDGGPDGNYQNANDGNLRIICAEGYKLNIVGTVNTETGCDPLYIYEYSLTGNTLISQTSGDNQSINVTSKTNDVLLYFHSDGSVVKSGISITVTIQRMTTDYNIAIADVAGGTMEANTYVANPEDTVYLTATPAEGYVLDHIRVETEGEVLTIYDDDPKAFSMAAQAQRHYLLNDTVRVRDGNWFHDTAFFLMPYGSVTVTPVFVNSDASLFVNLAGNDTLRVERKYIQRLIDGGMTRFSLYDHAGKNGNYGDSANGYTLFDAPVGWTWRIEGSTSLEGADHLYIYDGLSTSDYQLGDPHNSFGYSTYNNGLLCRFTSDGSVVYAGVDATLTLVPDDPLVGQYNIPAHGSLVMSEERMLPILNQGITSVKVYDNNGEASNYSNNIDGSITFTLPEGYRIRVHGSVDTERNYDVLHVFDNEVEKVAVSGQSASVDYTSESNSVRLRFHSDGGVVYSGLDLTVDFIPGE